MGKASAVTKRRKKLKTKKYVHTNKLKKLRSKQIRKSVKIENEIIRNSWDPKKNMSDNLSTMGLSLDPNKTLKVKSNVDVPKKKKKAKKNKSKEKTKVVEELETIAAKPLEKGFKFGVETSKFCVYMIEKYGEDYEAMARDKMNYYQESVGQIRQKIKKFKSIPLNWNSYLKAKETAEEMATD